MIEELPPGCKMVTDRVVGETKVKDLTPRTRSHTKVEFLRISFALNSGH
jgi:hypothetical protein